MSEEKAVAGQAARPVRIAGAAVLTGVEGAVVAGLGLWMLVLGIFGDPDSPRQAVFGGLTVIALAGLPLAAAWGLWMLKGWSRGPAMVTQIMAIPVVWAMIGQGGALLALGALLGAIALGALVMIFSPSTLQALGVGPRRA